MTIVNGEVVPIEFAVVCTAPTGVIGAGAELAFVSDRDGNTEIYVMKADGAQTRLTNNAAQDRDPSGHRTATRSRSCLATTATPRSTS